MPLSSCVRLAAAFVAILALGTSFSSALAQDAGRAARQEAFLVALIQEDVLAAQAGEETQLNFRNVKAQPAEAVARRVTRQFLEGRDFTDIAKKYDPKNRGLLFLLHHIGGTLAAGSPCLSLTTFDACDVDALPIETIAKSKEFRTAYEAAQIRLRLPTIEYAFPFL